jgi:KaiC/GvpD/RAD55 family RecA-like ATPase
VKLPSLRFGIPSLDTLFGGERFDGHGEESGIALPRSDSRSVDSSDTGVSICISGPDGTGKSILGMHMATRYVADCARFGASRPTVLYISTDLKFRMADRMWKNFGLDLPNQRKIPFERGEKGEKCLSVELIGCSPLQGSKESRPLSHHLHDKGDGLNVYFVDMASYTAGDDWGFVNRTLSALEEPGSDQPRHLMVIDSVEGFETLVGKHDAFGLVRERRSRTAQVMRSAGNKFHMVFIVEEPKEGERLPEDFVADVVIRLRSTPVRNYIRRSIEIEKARGHSHVRGQHTYLIRSGVGSYTGLSTNADDPLVENVNKVDRQPTQSYVHVCHSLHHSYRKVMNNRAKGRPAQLPERYAAFGIRYLDEMLGSKGMNFGRNKGDDERGLRCSTTTAIIGNAETQKGPLGVAFLTRCFREYAYRFYTAIGKKIEETKGKTDEQRRRYLLQGLPRTLEEAQASELGKSWGLSRTARHFEVLTRIKAARTNPADDKHGEYFEESSDPKKGVEIDPVILAAAWEVGPPNGKLDGVPVLLTTQDVHAQRLSLDFLPWLLRKVPLLKPEQRLHLGRLSALRMLMEKYIVCRRLEIHDLPSAVLIHILQRAIEEARSILYGDAPLEVAIPRSEQSRMIRVVIDDFSILKDTYIEIREEPLLLRFIVFYLGQEGVTTLLIDTQPGRPDMTVPQPLHSELRSLVDNRIFTWRFPFYGEDRVAIAVNAQTPFESPSVIRELRRSTENAKGPEALPLVVDPHFELYSGIEKGEPQPIPIEVWLYEETAAFKSYIDEENLRYIDLFTPLSKGERPGAGQVLVGVPSTDYDKLRDFCYLQRDTRLDYSLVLQVDEFWMMSNSPGTSTRAFRPMGKYLNAVVAEKPSGQGWEPEWAADPFRLFQKMASSRCRNGDECGASEEGDEKQTRRRKDEFHFIGYQKQSTDEEQTFDNQSRLAIDRIPFTWDFGFLLGRVHAWTGPEADVKLSILKRSKQRLCGTDEAAGMRMWEEEPFQSASDVWEGLPKATKERPEVSQVRPSWRVFLEACYQLARKQAYGKLTPVTAFDMYGASTQTLSSLILEIWASEIYEREQRIKENTSLPEHVRAAAEERLGELINRVKERSWPLKSADRESAGLIKWLEDYSLELFKAWLLLVEVVDFKLLANTIKDGTLTELKPDPTAIAVRHWYKTACQATEHLSFEEPVVPISLPGHFSVRGDWFLAVAGGSRSGRLADRALDLLSSRRANYSRLEKGLGLPTRKLYDPDRGLEEAELRTNLLTLDLGSQEGSDYATQEDGGSPSYRISRVKYSNLLMIGANEQGRFHWLWRSGLSDYDRHTRIWQDWLGQMIFWWDRMRYVERDNWVNGFERYDDIIADEKNGYYGVRDRETKQELLAWKKFGKRCLHVIEELRQATLEL